MMKEIESLVQLNKSTTINGINSIIHLEEVVLTEHNYYLVFEYCNGGDLRDMLVNCFPIKSETIKFIIK
jgi:serine/threonine protein kinase